MKNPMTAIVVMLCIAYPQIACSQKKAAEPYVLESLAGTSWEATEYNKSPATEDSKWIPLAGTGLVFQFHFRLNTPSVKYLEITPEFSILNRPDWPYTYDGKLLKIKNPDPEKHIFAVIIEATEKKMEWGYMLPGKPIEGMRLKRID